MSNKNPHKPGSYEYLEWATAQHDEATKPKTKVKQVQTKTEVQKNKKVSRADELMGLAGELVKQRKKVAGFGQ